MRFTRNKTTQALVALAAVATFTLTGCGPKSAGTAAGSSAPTASSSVSSSPPATDTVPATCPTQNTRAFAKTRLVADLGLAAGTFHRYIYKPYKAGAFDKGAHGRILALVKAGATAAADVKLLSNATENIKANPTLCRVLYQPVVALEGKLSSLKSDVVSGNLGSVDSAESLVSGLVSSATTNGLAVKESITTTTP